MMNKLIILLTIFISLIVKAQGKFTVTGHVEDNKNMSLAYVSYVIENEIHHKILKGGITDSLGNFKVAQMNAGKYLLKVSMIGYQDEVYHLEVDRDSSLMITLRPKSNQLETVTITTGRKQPIVQKSDRVVMNVANSVLATGNNVYDLLKMAPAVSVSVDGIEVQGKGSVLIILNGKILPNASIKDLLESIPSDQIDRIEVITSPSVKYDAQATSVIEIYTKNTLNTDSWGGNVSLNAAQGRKFHSGGNLGLFFNKNKFSFNLSGGYQNNSHLEVGGFERLVYKGKDEIGKVKLDKDLGGKIKAMNLSSQLGYQLTDKQKIGLDLSLMDVDIAVEGRMDSRMEQYQPQSETYNPLFMGLDMITKFNSANLLYDFKLDDLGSSFDVSGNYTYYQNRQDQKLLPLEDKENEIFNDIKASYDILTGMINYRKMFNETNSLELGLKYTNTKNNSQETTLTSSDKIENTSLLGYNENILGLYANYNITATDFFKLQLGIRGENTSYKVRDNRDSSYWNLFPKVRLDFTVSPEYSTALYYTSSINRPIYDLLVPYTRYFDNYSGQEGNPQLNPEFSNIIGWSHRYKNYSLSFEYEHVRHAISTQVSYDEDKLFYMSKVVNFSKRELLGVNLSIPFKIGKFWQSYNMIGIYRQLNNIPDPFSQLNVNKRNTYPNLKTNNIFNLGKDWDMDLSAFYRGEVLSGINWSEEISNVSLGIRKQLLSKKGFIKIDVSDIFLGQVQRWGSDFIPVRFTARSRNDSRRVRLTVGYKFGKTLNDSNKSSAEANKEERNRLGI
ncbi:TonB-dependent receptor domain-containing protein [Sphingobacterium kitahiroshimense]|uniref:TonB-dependent receptor n=1 Tax=Sphingobacterium kitahiroshimense TaxID=470446 RepID=A0ABV0BR13_9SPHI